jgi:alcohol dehydrogenase (NADP+)
MGDELGLGHFAVMFAAALGAEVYVLSHSPNKKDDAIKMGAKHFIVTNDEGWHKDLAFTFDFILNCADATHKVPFSSNPCMLCNLADSPQFDLKAYFGTLKVMGRFHNVGFGDHPLPELMAQDFAGNGKCLVPRISVVGLRHLLTRDSRLLHWSLAHRQPARDAGM